MNPSRSCGVGFAVSFASPRASHAYIHAKYEGVAFGAPNI